MSWPVAVDSIPARIAAVQAALAAALPARRVTRDFLAIDRRQDTDLLAGVVTLIAAGEGGYAAGPGMSARHGVTHLVLACHLRVADDAAPSAVEDTENALIEEIKAFVRAGVAGVTLTLDRVDQSRQIEHPYGWVVAHVQAGPPKASTH